MFWNLFYNRSANHPKNVAPSARRPPHRVHLDLESLEARLVPTVNYYGGALLRNVEVQGVYYGSDWSTNPAYFKAANYLESSLDSLVHGSYLSMLDEAGYDVGTGSSDPGRILLTAFAARDRLMDSQIQNRLQSEINNGTLVAPNRNMLYVVFVQDNVAVQQSDGSDSVHDFLGYHGAFAGYDALHNATTIHYAVVTFPGGSVGNAGTPGLSVLDSMTVTASHEIAEAATDPNVNYSTPGWYDVGNHGEVGDLAARQIVYLKGYAVQRIVDQNDQPMTPAGATAARPVSFVLHANGQLWEYSDTGWTMVASGVASVSDQGIDNNGRAFVDLVTSNGNAYEYHDGYGPVRLMNHVQSAVAGQGVSYVLLSNGTLLEYVESTDSWNYLDSNVSAINAGTDQEGVNAVDVIYAGGDAWEVSDSSGWNFIASGVRSISAGQQGLAGYVTARGNAYLWNEATSGTLLLASNAAQVALGTDENGNSMIDLVFSDGTLKEFRVDSGWSFLGSWVASVSKGRAGEVDAIFAFGAVQEHTPSDGWIPLGHI
jgi:hypothetical protein